MFKKILFLLLTFLSTSNVVGFYCRQFKGITNTDSTPLVGTQNDKSPVASLTALSYKFALEHIFMGLSKNVSIERLFKDFAQLPYDLNESLRQDVQGAQLVVAQALKNFVNNKNDNRSLDVLPSAMVAAHINANINAKSGYQTALNFACATGQLAKIGILLQKGAGGYEEKFPIVLEWHNPQRDAVKTLLEEHGVNFKDNRVMLRK